MKSKIVMRLLLVSIVQIISSCPSIEIQSIGRRRGLSQSVSQWIGNIEKWRSKNEIKVKLTFSTSTTTDFEMKNSRILLPLYFDSSPLLRLLPINGRRFITHSLVILITKRGSLPPCLVFLLECAPLKFRWTSQHQINKRAMLMEI